MAVDPTAVIEPLLAVFVSGFVSVVAGAGVAGAVALEVPPAPQPVNNNPTDSILAIKMDEIFFKGNPPRHLQII